MSQNKTRSIFLAVILCFSATSLAPRPGHAVRCLVQPGLERDPASHAACFFIAGLLIPLFGAGLILLDARDGTERAVSRFAPLKPLQASSLGLSTSQALAFNGEISELNAALDDLETSRPSFDEAHMNEILSRWRELTANLNPSAVEAAERVLSRGVARSSATR